MRSRLLTLFLSVAVVVALTSVSVAASANEVKKPARRSHYRPAKYKPLSVPDCINRIKALANQNPFPSYRGEPEKLINRGLLWDPPRNEKKAGCEVLPKLTAEDNYRDQSRPTGWPYSPWRTWLWPYSSSSVFTNLQQRKIWAGIGQTWRLGKAEEVRNALAQIP